MLNTARFSALVLASDADESLSICMLSCAETVHRYFCVSIAYANGWGVGLHYVEQRTGACRSSSSTAGSAINSSTSGLSTGRGVRACTFVDTLGRRARWTE